MLQGEKVLVAGATGQVALPLTLALASDNEVWAHRFAQGTAIYGGTTDVHRNIIAEQFLGMPRSRPSSAGT